MPPKKKVAVGYKHAEPLPKGEILEDISKKKWKLGSSIGKGGFGEIYCAREANSSGSNYPYVIKIEPHSNGPLFVEMHFYMRNAKPADILEFQKEKGLKSLGMPVYYGSGSHDYKNDKYRFLVMDKFGNDLWKLYKDNKNIFPTDTVFKLAVQILDVLEYIHGRGYVHADIKPANILLGATKETKTKQVYLIDFGLATKYTLDKEFKPNPKKAHDGTIEFLSRDAHQGVQTRRGDLEILGYNLITWLGGKLPWEQNLSNPKVVQSSKEEHMKNINKMIKTCFGIKTVPKALTEFLNYINTLKFDAEPDYVKIRKIFISEIKKSGGSLDSPLQFSSTNGSPSRRRSITPDSSISGKRRKKIPNENSVDDIDDIEDDKPKRRYGREKIVKEKSEVRKAVIEDDGDIPEDKPRFRRGQAKKAVTEDDDDIPEDKPRFRRGQAKKAVTEDDDDIPEDKPRFRRGQAKKTIGISKEEGPESVEDYEDVPVKKKTRLIKKKSPTSESVIGNGKAENEDDDPFQGYTDAMREIAMKKVQNGEQKRRKPPSRQKIKPISEKKVEEDMTGYTRSKARIPSR